MEAPEESAALVHRDVSMGWWDVNMQIQYSMCEARVTKLG